MNTERLRHFLRRTREWSRAERGLHLFHMAAKDLMAFVEIDSGFFVYRKRLHPDGTVSPHEPRVFAPWGQLERNSIELADCLSEALGRMDILSDYMERWVAVDEIPWPTIQTVLRQKGIPEIGIWPLYSREKLIGALVVTRGEGQGTSSSEEEIAVLDTCAAQISVALDLILAIRLAEEASQTDWLTGTLNRRGLENRFPDFVAKAKEANRNVVFGLIDLNDLKAINDTYGHPVGDETLQKIAGIIQTSLGDAGLIARFGGDEFAIILQTEADSAEEEMRRIQDAVCHLAGGHSVSVGGAVWGRDGSTIDVCYQVADERMYRDKRVQKP